MFDGEQLIKMTKQVEPAEPNIVELVMAPYQRHPVRDADQDDALADRQPPLVLARGSDDKVRCFSNVCTHRGTLLCEGHGGRLPDLQMRCPYHGWTFGTDGTLRALGKCLDVTEWGTGNGSKLQIWDCNPGQSNQTWVRSGDGYRNPASGRCLDNPDGAAVSGQRTQLWDCYGNTAQTWSLPGT